jgi:hypothetical protein
LSRKTRVLTRWEANCLFCGTGLADEGEAFSTHMQRAPACHDAWVHWVEELDHDRLGG